MRILLLLLAAAIAGCVDPLDSADLGITGGPLDMDTTVRFDTATRPTEHLYSMHGKDHADGFTAHDLLFEWARQGGHGLETEWFDAGFGHGYSLCAIDDFPAKTVDGAKRGCFDRDGFWAIRLNGVAAEVGMSDILVVDGDTLDLTWTTF